MWKTRENCFCRCFLLLLVHIVQLRYERTQERKELLQQKNGQVLPDEELLCAREVAEHLRVDETSVRRWIKGGVLPAIILPHVGTRKIYRIRRADVEAILGKM